MTSTPPRARTVRSDEARRTLPFLLGQAGQGAHITILRYNAMAAVLVPPEWYEQASRAMEGDR